MTARSIYSIIAILLESTWEWGRTASGSDLCLPLSMTNIMTSLLSVLKFPDNLDVVSV
jgi:hypothetical protein